MRVFLTSEARFERTPDGAIWGAAAYGPELWMRYLDVFSNVLIAARIVDVRAPSPASIRTSLRDVQFWPLPPYSGLSGLVQAVRDAHGRIAAALRCSPAVIVRSPSPIAILAARAAVAARRPYGAEIVGDPRGVFAAGAFRHPLRTPIRSLATAAQTQLSRKAIAVLYVTRDALQRDYPTTGSAFAASDAALDDSAFLSGTRRVWRRPAPFVLVTVGGLDQPYKGTAVLLEAVRELRKRGEAVRLRIVGGGRLMPDLQRQSVAQGTSADIEFLGPLSRAHIREALDSADLFVLPSLTEGLPRALLEAMARGLPAVASDVGGVPELLPRESLVPAGQPRALADRIAQMITDDGRRDRLAERNRSEARRHHASVQAAVRRAFLRAVKDAVAKAPGEARCA